MQQPGLQPSRYACTAQAVSKERAACRAACPHVKQATARLNSWQSQNSAACKPERVTRENMQQALREEEP